MATAPPPEDENTIPSEWMDDAPAPDADANEDEGHPIHEALDLIIRRRTGLEWYFILEAWGLDRMAARRAIVLLKATTDTDHALMVSRLDEDGHPADGGVVVRIEDATDEQRDRPLRWDLLELPPDE